MYRTTEDLEIKLRLGEINQRSAELSAVSLELGAMVAQLPRLRKAYEKIGAFSDRNSSSRRQKAVTDFW